MFWQQLPSSGFPEEGGIEDMSVTLKITTKDKTENYVL